jgi:hypothetical protein
VTEFRAVRTLATERDDCAHCRHATPRPYAGGGTLLMCAEESTLRAFGRELVAASVARADWCDGRMWSKRA